MMMSNHATLAMYTYFQHSWLREGSELTEGMLTNDFKTCVIDW